jgi:SAM-dependent methyltransferase
MLIEEAQWLGDQLRALDPARVFPLLDIGSSTAEFRTRDQPWIDRLIFAPARLAKRTVLHIDAKPAPGVDIVADVNDNKAMDALAGRGFNSVLCSNLLEHVPDPAAIAKRLVELVPHGGYLLVSGPYRYPYHPDPIDTMFRPTPSELAAIFPGTGLVRHAVVTGGTYFDEFRRAPASLPRLVARLLLPFYKPASWRREWIRFVNHAPWMFRRFEASCVLLVRDGPALPSPRGEG